MSNLLTIRRMTRNRLGIPVTDDFHRDEVIDDNINLALLHAEEAHRWPWQERREERTVESGVNTFDVPDDWRATRSVMFENRELLPLNPYDMDRFTVRYAGVPTHWALLDRQIIVGPQPTGQVQFVHYYYKTPKLLANDEDEPEMPGEYVGVIIAKAAELLSVREDDRASAAAHQAEYRDWLDNMQKDLRRYTRPVGRRIRPGSWV